MQVATHTQNCPKNGPLKARLMAWAAKLREKILTRLRQNSTLLLYFFAFQTIISRFHDEHFIERKIFGDAVGWKIYVCNDGFVLPALKKSWNRIQSGNHCFWLWWRLLLQCKKVIQILASSFTFTGFFLPHQFSQTIRHRGITYGTSKQDKGTTGLERPRAV